jgi:hypothetical protein
VSPAPSSLASIVDVVATRPGAGPVEVTGDGEVAAAVRAAVGAGAAMETAPACIVETTGRPEVIERSRARQADLGLLVQAGAPQPLTIDLYADVHVRGLRVVGVPPVV